MVSGQTPATFTGVCEVNDKMYLTHSHFVVFLCLDTGGIYHVNCFTGNVTISTSESIGKSVGKSNRMNPVNGGCVMKSHSVTGSVLNMSFWTPHKLWMRNTPTPHLNVIWFTSWHRSRSKMADILQPMFLNVCYYMKVTVSLFRCDWSLLSTVQFTNSQHCCRSDHDPDHCRM